MNDEIVNHGIVTITDITEREPLLCVTDRIDCCPPGDPGVSNGQWYFPDGSAVPEGSEGNFYQTSAFAAVRLHRTNGMTNGIFRCDIPDTMGNVRSLHIGIYNVGAGKIFILCVYIAVLWYWSNSLKSVVSLTVQNDWLICYPMIHLLPMV